MFRNYLTVALRNIRRQRGHTFINVSGLAIGMACAFFIFFFIQNELGYDGYHRHSKQIFRITQESHRQGVASYSAVTPNPLAPEMLLSFSEIKAAVRLQPMHEDVLIRFQDKVFKEARFFLADPSVFTVFTFPLNRGDFRTVLEDPFSVVISETAARKYFGNMDPVGQVITFENKFDFKVTGVMQDIPQRSHFHCDFIAPFACADALFWEGYSDDRTQSSVRTYVLLEESASARDLERKLPDFINGFLSPVISEYGPMINQLPGGIDSIRFMLHLQPLLRIHLYSHLAGEIEPNYDIRYVALFSAIGIVILLIACMNFINLSTACAGSRAAEVGMRKVVGAERKQLMEQILGESIIMSIASLLAALFLLYFSFPILGRLVGRPISFHNCNVWLSIPGLLLITLFVGIASGIYPALVISRFNPVEALKGGVRPGSKGGLRSVLVVAQFMVSIVMIISTFTIIRQIDFLSQKDLGFEKENVVVIPLEDEQISRKYDSIKHEIQKSPDIIGVTGSSNVLSRIYASTPIWWEGAEANESIRIQKLYVDEDFIETFEIALMDGDGFSRTSFSVQYPMFILNESAVKALRLDSPVGKQIAWASSRDRTGRIVGIIRDFHFRSLHEKVEPLVLQFRPGGFNDMYVRIHAGRISDALVFLEKTWKRIVPERPFTFFFLDLDIDRMYSSEQRMREAFQYATFLAIFIACLGLLGLTSYTVEKRTKEIGIRKVLGASIPNILFLLSGDLLKRIFVANLLAWPLAYYGMTRWLQSFAYRIHLKPWIFFESTILVLGIAVVTVGYRSVKVATTNPVSSLKYE
jgi:putative ABC transport system permease protein